MRKLHAVVAVLAGWGAAASTVLAVSVPAVFSDNMVLQQDMKVPIWGKGTPGEAVTVTLADQAEKATARADGKWKCVLRPMKAGGPLTLTISGTNTITITNVVVGEVWLCGGQSNMQFPVMNATNAAADMAAATFPGIRMFTAKQVVIGEPQDDVPGKWEVCSPETVKTFSAVGFFFGREIHKARKTPVGLIHSSCGWTPGEAWMPREALLAEPELKYIVDRWDAIANGYPAAKKEHDAKMAEWQQAVEKAKAEGKEAPPQPKGPPDPNFIHRASGLWNGSIAPFVPYAMRGVIWYQGETNEVRGHQYRKLFQALIRCWREQWGMGDFPFLFVQVSAVLPPDPQPVESEWAELREAQALALALPKTGMAVTIDIGEEKDVHPKNKQDVGLRLGLAARALVYGENIPYSGPIYKAMKVKGTTIRLSFDHTEKGLAAKGGEAPRGFDIAGADHKFVRAQARIEGDAVVVWSDAVKDPVAVRYAWANNPAGCNLFNGAGLPASPFRTDDWPGKTVGFTKMTVDMM